MHRAARNRWFADSLRWREQDSNDRFRGGRGGFWAVLRVSSTRPQKARLIDQDRRSRTSHSSASRQRSARSPHRENVPCGLAGRERTAKLVVVLMQAELLIRGGTDGGGNWFDPGLNGRQRPLPSSSAAANPYACGRRPAARV